MKKANIAIIGAGIMGLSTAYELHMRGQSIAIYDTAGFPADNASLKAGGMLAPYSEIEHMPQQWIEAGLAGIEVWDKMAEDLGDIGFQRNGSLLIAHAEDRYILERFMTHLPAAQQTRADIKAHEPTIADRLPSGVFLEKEAHLSPEKTMKAIIARLHGHIEFKAESRTPENLCGQYDHIIDCRGMCADDPEIRGVKGEIVIVRNTDFSLSRPVRMMHPRYPLYIVPREDHHFMIGATVIESADNEAVNVRSAMELMSALYSLHPSFGDAAIIDIQAGIRPSYPDNLPRIKTTEKVTRCNGLFRHGYLLAPVMASAVADRLEGKTHAYMSLFDAKEEGKDDEHHDHNQRAA